MLEQFYFICMIVSLWGNTVTDWRDGMHMLFVRAFIFYFFLIMTIRILGKRQLGEMEPSEFVVSLLVADLAAGPMQEINMPIVNGIIPIVVVLICELLLSKLSYHFIAVRKLFCGKPVILMEDGKILQNNLKSTRVTPDELTEHLREKGVLDLSTVKYAILETNGQISVLLDPQYEPVTASALGVATSPIALPYTIICNGRLIADNLKLSGKSEKWLQHVLSSRKCTIRQVLLLTVDAQDNIYLCLDTKKGAVNSTL